MFWFDWNLSSYSYTNYVQQNLHLLSLNKLFMLVFVLIEIDLPVLTLVMSSRTSLRLK